MASTNPSSGESNNPLPLKVVTTLWRSFSQWRAEGPDGSTSARKDLQSVPSQAQAKIQDTTFKWERLWPVPLYCAAFLVHKGLRVRYPRTWRRLTPFKLPEVYGAGALGHAAYIEGNRLSLKTAQDPNTNSIERFAETLKTTYWERPDFHDPEFKIRAAFASFYAVVHGTDDIPVRTLDPGTYGYTTWMTAMFWSDPVALYLASGLMLSRCEAAGMSLHDTKILVNFISQRVANPDFYRVPISFGSVSFCALLIFLSEWDRSAWRRGTRLLVNGIQRTFFYSIGIRWLGGYYRHYASIWDLEDLPKAAAVAMRAQATVFE